jgi:hypothetical protein
MALPATETFTGTNGDPLSSNWTVLDGGFQVQSNRIEGTIAETNAAFWDADSFADDQYAQATIHPNAGAWNQGVLVRSAAPCVGYLALASTATTLALLRLDGLETYVNLQTLSGLSPSLADGDLLRLVVVGTRLRMFVNGVQRGTDSTDSTYASGSAGILCYGVSAGRLDNFDADNTGPGTRRVRARWRRHR